VAHHESKFALFPTVSLPIAYILGLNCTSFRVRPHLRPMKDTREVNDTGKSEALLDWEGKTEALVSLPASACSNCVLILALICVCSPQS
jgi:hypothetical protein